MDLTQQPPRSPYDQLAGIVWLPRLIDKARAKLAGKQGDYNFAPPKMMDSYFLHKMGLDADAFLEAVRTHPDDAGVAAWVEANRKPQTPEELGEFNKKFAAMPTRGFDDWKHYTRAVAALGEAATPTWFQVLDADEGRVPAKA